MNLHHLKVFLAVADAGSISAGAEQLHISQPAVTREIRELEARLDLILFDRLPRGVALTEAGQRLHHYAERIFALEHAAEREMRGFAGLAEGELRLAASATLGTYLLPALISRFRALHPGIHIDLQVSNTRLVTELLDDERASLGFVEGPFPRDAYASHLLERDRLLPVSGPQHPLARRSDLHAADLSGQDLYLREQGSGTRAAIEQAYHDHGLELCPRLSIASSEALKHLVQDGQGIAWLSQRAVGSELSNGSLVQLQLDDLQIERELHVLWHTGRSLSPAPTAFLALAQERH